MLKLFRCKVKTKIIRDKEPYLLYELLNDVKYLSEEQELDMPAIEHTSTLKMYLVKTLQMIKPFLSSRKYLVVHPLDNNPCTYSLATLHGCGLRDADTTKAFGKMIRGKIEGRKSFEETWPLTPGDVIPKLDNGPLSELYISIYFSVYE